MSEAAKNKQNSNYKLYLLKYFKSLERALNNKIFAKMQGSLEKTCYNELTLNQRSTRNKTKQRNRLPGKNINK